MVGVARRGVWLVGAGVAIGTETELANNLGLEEVAGASFTDQGMNKTVSVCELCGECGVRVEVGVSWSHGR